MKITEIINKVEKTTKNECAIPVSIMWQSLGLPTEALFSAYLQKSIIECDNRLKGYWVQRHNSDLVPSGFCVYFLDNEPIAISNTNINSKTKLVFNSFGNFFCHRNTIFKFWNNTFK